MEKELTKIDIYKSIIKRIEDDAIYILAAIKNQEGLVKHRLEEESNKLYQKQNDKQKLINSRFTLDILVAKLEGASLIRIKEQGRSKQYLLSDIGIELIDYFQNEYIKQ